MSLLLGSIREVRFRPLKAKIWNFPLFAEKQWSSSSGRHGAVHVSESFLTGMNWLRSFPGSPLLSSPYRLMKTKIDFVSFLKTTPMRGISAWDPDQKWFKAYEARPIPHTVIVDSAGRIVGVTSLAKLTVEVLEKIIGGVAFHLPPKEVFAANVDWDRTEIIWEDGIEPLLQVIIKPASATGSALRYSPGSNRLAGDGMRLKALIYEAYETSPSYLDYRLPHSTQGYRVSALVPPGQEARLLPLFREALKASLGLSIRWETQEKEVLVLKQLPGEKKQASTFTSGEKCSLVGSGHPPWIETNYGGALCCCC